MQLRTLMLVAFVLSLLVPAIAWAGPESSPVPVKPRAFASMASFADSLALDSRLARQNERLRAENRKLRKNLSAHGRMVRGLQRELLKTRWHPVWYAYRLASAAYGIAESKLRAVAGCESGHWPFARNGQYRGLFQEGPMFEAGPFGRAGFSVWDPIVNALTAAYTVWRDGSWRQWECG